MNRAEHLRRQQWNAASQLSGHVLLAETYWDDGRGARWVIGQPGTHVGLCEIFSGMIGSLIVHGDYDLCRFAHYGDHNAWSRLRWMADCTDIDYYVAQKAAIGLKRQEIETYDQDVARDRLTSEIERYTEESNPGAVEVLREALDEHTESREALLDFLYRNGTKWELWDTDAGKVLEFRVVVSHVALNRCAWLLRERHGMSGPPQCRCTIEHRRSA